MEYNLKTIREAGLEARWTKTTHGAPIIVARDPSKGNEWFYVDLRMWQCMRVEGIREAFERFTLLGDIFSVPA